MNSKLFNKYWWIARRLQTEQLQRISSKSINFSDQDLFRVDIGPRGGEYFLGFYSHDGLNIALEKYGVFKKLNKIGFKNVFSILDTSDPYKHKLAVYTEKQDSDHLLIELVLRKQFLEINSPFKCDINKQHFQALAIDWLCMQNPGKKFTAGKPMLPGQRFPGLGMSEIAVELLMIISWRLKLAGLVNIPEHYHNALLYSKIFYYINPEIQAKFLALAESLSNLPLDIATWGTEWGCVIDEKTNQEFNWIVEKQIVPMDVKLKKYFFNSEYQQYVEKLKKKFKFKFDMEKYNKLKNIKSRKIMEKQI